MFGYSTQTINNDHNEFKLEDEEDDEENNNDSINDNLINDEQANDIVADQADDDDSIITIKANFNGMTTYEKIEPCQQHSYFKVQINDVQKYMHKQSTCWLLTEKNMHLSNDRLARVIQTSRKDNKNVFSFIVQMKIFFANKSRDISKYIHTFPYISS